MLRMILVEERGQDVPAARPPQLGRQVQAPGAPRQAEAAGQGRRQPLGSAQGLANPMSVSQHFPYSKIGFGASLSISPIKT